MSWTGKARSCVTSAAWKGWTPSFRLPCSPPSQHAGEQPPDSDPRVQLQRASGDPGRDQEPHDERACREQSTKQVLQAHLFTRDLPDPDLIIRTSGEHRISNFLLWQSAYSEFFFTPTLWPDFGPEDLSEAVCDYGRRERRFGGVMRTNRHRLL